MTRRYWLALLLGLPAAAKVAPKPVLPPKTIGLPLTIAGIPVRVDPGAPRNMIYFIDQNKSLWELSCRRCTRISQEFKP